MKPQGDKREKEIRLERIGEDEEERLGRESRRELRQPIAFAAYHRLAPGREGAGESSWGLTTIKNISPGGLLFISDVPYGVSDVLEMKLEPSDVEYSFVFRADVIRVKEQVPGSLYYIAVTIHPGDRDNIKGILSGKGNVKSE